MNAPVSAALAGEDLHGSPARYLNRELSWLRFNMRVMDEAENPNHPVLERLRFLSISASNLDEFYMVRVAGLRAQMRNGVAATSIDGLTPSEQVEQIHVLASELLGKQQQLWLELRDEAARAGVEVLQPEQLSKTDEAWLRGDFLSHTLPVITPLAIDPAHPFPFIPNLGFTLALQLRNKRDKSLMNALIPLPSGVGRFVELPALSRDDNTPARPGGLLPWKTFWRCLSIRSSRGTSWSARAHSGSFATAISRSRKSPKIWCSNSRTCSNSAGAV